MHICQTTLRRDRDRRAGGGAFGDGGGWVEGEERWKIFSLSSKRKIPN